MSDNCIIKSCGPQDAPALQDISRTPSIRLARHPISQPLTRELLTRITRRVIIVNSNSQKVTHCAPRTRRQPRHGWMPWSSLKTLGQSRFETPNRFLHLNPDLEQLVRRLLWMAAAKNTRTWPEPSQTMALSRERAILENGCVCKVFPKARHRGRAKEIRVLEIRMTPKHEKHGTNR